MRDTVFFRQAELLPRTKIIFKNIRKKGERRGLLIYLLKSRAGMRQGS